MHPPIVTVALEHLASFREDIDVDHLWVETSKTSTTLEVDRGVCPPMIIVLDVISFVSRTRDNHLPSVEKIWRRPPKGIQINNCQTATICKLHFRPTFIGVVSPRFFGRLVNKDFQSISLSYCHHCPHSMFLQEHTRLPFTHAA